MNDDVYIPAWSLVQRVIELTKAAGGRHRKDAHLPERISYADIPRKHFKSANLGVVTSTSGCKMHARIDLPDAEGPDHTTLCAVCDAPDMFPRVDRELR